MVIMLVFVITSYILILLGLTVWLDKYHYHKNTYFDDCTIRNNEKTPISELTSSQVNPEKSHCQKAK